jgi:hypothetical protein
MLVRLVVTSEVFTVQTTTPGGHQIAEPRHVRVVVRLTARVAKTSEYPRWVRPMDLLSTPPVVLNIVYEDLVSDGGYASLVYILWIVLLFVYTRNWSNPNDGYTT